MSPHSNTAIAVAKYKLSATSAFPSKKIEEKYPITAVFAEHGTNGISPTVERRCCGQVIVRADNIAGTLQPQPIVRQITLFPLSPSGRSNRSVTKATRAR